MNQDILMSLHSTKALAHTSRRNMTEQSERYAGRICFHNSDIFILVSLESKPQAVKISDPSLQLDQQGSSLSKDVLYRLMFVAPSHHKVLSIT